MSNAWGRKLVYRKLGHVADFCPICHEPKAMTLRRIGLADHVCYLAEDEGELVSHERTCLDCKTSFEAEAAAYASVSEPLLPLAELKRATFPDMDAVLHERLALEDKVRNSPASLGADERHALIRAPLLLFSSKVEQRFATRAIVGRQIDFGMAVVILLIIGRVMAISLPGEPQLLMLGAALAAAALVIWQYVISGRRYMRRAVIPTLVRALGPLRPARPEVALVLAELGQHGHKIGNKLRLDDLFSTLESKPA